MDSPFPKQNNPMHDLNDLVIFAKVVQSGSLTAAANALDIPKSNVSRRLSRLEEELGVRLLERTTRKLHLTEVGGLYYEHCRRILEEVEHAELSVQQRLEAPRGQLRIGASFSVGQGLLGPILGEFIARYPEVSVQLELTNRRVDLIEEGYDLVLRVGKLEESNLVARYLGNSQLVCFASKAYLDQHGRPQHPQELVKHHCLTMSDMPNPERWTFYGPNGEETVQVQSRAAVNDFATLRVMAAAGAGVAISPGYLCRAGLLAGDLEQVLPDWPLVPGGIHAVYPSHRGATPKLRALLDFLVEKLAPVISSHPCDGKALL